MKRAALGVFAVWVVSIVGGCVTTQGWRWDDRVCQDEDPPRVCFEAQPDAPLSLRVGDVRLAPGECAFAPDGARGGSIRVALEHGARGAVDRRWVGTRRGRTTSVVATPDRMTIDRTACRRTR